MSRFIPPTDQINNITPKKSKRSFSDRSKQSIFHDLKKTVKESFESDAFAQVGQMNAVVLEVIQEDISKMIWKNPLMSYLLDEKGTVPDYVEIRFRIPEMHAHLPVPQDEKDFAAINRHPKAYLKKEKGMPKPGDIVVIDFQDKNNFNGAMVMETVNSNTSAGPGGQCSIPGIMNSATPLLNVEAPTGDAQENVDNESEIKNDPAEESMTEGIEEPDVQEPPAIYNFKYMVSITEFNSLPEFQNTFSAVETLVTKNVTSICFTLYDRANTLKDRRRLIEMLQVLKENDIEVGVGIKTGESRQQGDFATSLMLLNDIASEGAVNYLLLEISDQQANNRSAIDAVSSMADKFGIPSYKLYTRESYDFDGIGDQENVVISANVYDYADIKDQKPSLYDDYGDNSKLKMFYLGGINFIKSDEEPCLYGERSAAFIKNEVPQYGTDVVFINNYENLDGDILKVMDEKLSDDVLAKKQNFLNSIRKVEKQKRKNIDDKSAATDTLENLGSIEEVPSLNSEDPSATQPADMPLPETNMTPGLACTPSGMGGMGMSFAGVPPQPSVRFDQLENHENLLWTCSSDKLVNDIIVQFMDQLSSQVISMLGGVNSPSIAGSTYKKLRVTSTFRTAETQVYLMWDKMDKGGENEVWELYGNSRKWVRDVVDGWRRKDKAFAVAAVQAKINSNPSGHAIGKAVDIHTWSHIKAEGLPYDGISKDQMKQSTFVNTVLNVANSMGSKAIVEAYQQHIHITIK